MNLGLRVFLFGVLGSCAVEIVRIVSFYQEGRSRFPARYRKKGFWAVRLVLAVTGGLLATAHGVQTDILAVHIGAATPTIIEAFARRPPDGAAEDAADPG